MKGNIFLIGKKSQLINVEGIIKLEDYHFATNTVRINSGMNLNGC